MPISRVRSVTETSMMFIMPMPPTSRLTAGDGTEKYREDCCRRGLSCSDLLHVGDSEVVLLSRRDVAALAQKTFNIGLHLRRVCIIFC